MDYILTAYNELSNASCVVNISFDTVDPLEAIKNFIIITVIVLSILIILGLFFVIRYLYRKKRIPLVFNEDMAFLGELEVHEKKDENLDLNSTMTTSSILKQEVIKELVYVKSDKKLKDLMNNNKGDRERFSTEMQIKKKIKGFNKNF